MRVQMFICCILQHFSKCAKVMTNASYILNIHDIPLFTWGGCLGWIYRQLYFKDIFVGALIYAVTLGFFNDYTSIVEAKSFSTIFYGAVVLEILTFLTFLIVILEVNPSEICLLQT